ncbi:hypothetical protein CHELA1G11_10669 [Hyphomicrobiales bacterium]|nr:hypothetical protein CHELA1G11_10669 [Hyphomicrobiales bacterium]CAH1673054.1 hypothetical protein CHELA1G2_13635 [Hyphomicrobiales bacterium]
MKCRPPKVSSPGLSPQSGLPDCGYWSGTWQQPRSGDPDQKGPSIYRDGRDKPGHDNWVLSIQIDWTLL